MSFIDGIKAKAKQNIKTIILPESEDERTIRAAAKVLEDGLAKIILIGNENTIRSDAAKYGVDVSGAAFVDPENCSKFEEYQKILFELRQKKGMTMEGAKERICAM